MADKKPEDEDIPQRVIEEVKEISKEGLDHPRAKPALIGAALGTIGGLALIGDGMGLVIGAIVGGLAGIYFEIKK